MTVRTVDNPQYELASTIRKFRIVRQVKTVDNPQYELACDGCGTLFASGRGRKTYSLRWLLVRSAREAGWETDGRRDLCPDCQRKGVFA